MFHDMFVYEYHDVSGCYMFHDMFVQLVRMPPMKMNLRYERGYITGLRHHFYGVPARVAQQTFHQPTNQPT